MKDLKSIFNHPPKAKPENEPHLYDWKRPFHGKDDGEALNRLLNQKKKRHTKVCLYLQKTYSKQSKQKTT